MNTVLLRAFSLIVLTVSLSTSRVNAQYSVCYPVPETETSLPINQCDDYLELAAEGDQALTENWIERVSDSLEVSNSKHVVMPVKAKPTTATPIEFEFFYPARTRSKAAVASDDTDKETDGEIEFDLCDEVKAMEEELAAAGGENESAQVAAERNVIITRQNIPPTTQICEPEFQLETNQQITQSNPTDDSHTVRRVRNNVDAHSAYDLYLAEANFLYGALGFQAISEIFPPVNTPNLAMDDSTEQLACPSSTVEINPLADAIRLDGYLPYDLPCMIGENEIAKPEKVIADIAMPEMKQPQSSSPSQLIGIQELALIRKLVSHHFEMTSKQVVELFSQTNRTNWSNEIEAALCGTAALDFWRDAVWAHQRSIEIGKKEQISRLDPAQIKQILIEVDNFKSRIEKTAQQLFNDTASKSTRLIGWRIKNNK